MVMEENLPEHKLKCLPSDSEKIGRWGEALVYRKLGNHYKNKYKDCMFSETEDGFKLEGSYKNNPLKLVVTWFNKNGESQKSADFMVTKNDELTRYIEVKSSQSSIPTKMFISHSDFLVCQNTTVSAITKI